MPTGSQIGVLALIVGILALAQRLGDWRSKKVASGLAVVAAALFVMWCFWYAGHLIQWQSGIVVLVGTGLTSISLWSVKKNLAKPRGPCLKYNVVTEGGHWVFGTDGVFDLLVMEITNTETRFVNEANNVRGTIEYQDDLKLDRYITKDALWKPRHQNISPGLYESVSLSGGEMEHLIFCRKGSDQHWETSVDRDRRTKPLKPGHWNVRVNLRGDNCSLKLIGGFTILADNRFEPDVPLLRPMPLWQALWWSGK